MCTGYNAAAVAAFGADTAVAATLAGTVAEPVAATVLATEPPTVPPTVTPLPITLPATLAPAPAPPLAIAQLGATGYESGGTHGRRLSEHTETHVHSVTVSFSGGLKYEMDNILMDEMIKEGLFKNVEDVPSGDTPLRIHSYEIHDLTPAQKYSVSETIQKAVQSSQTSLVLSAFVGCALLGVTFVVRRARNSYQRVEENYFGPVE